MKSVEYALDDCPNGTKLTIHAEREVEIRKVALLHRLKGVPCQLCSPGVNGIDGMKKHYDLRRLKK